MAADADARETSVGTAEGTTVPAGQSDPSKEIREWRAGMLRLKGRAALIPALIADSATAARRGAFRLEARLASAAVADFMVVEADSMAVAVVVVTGNWNFLEFVEQLEI